MTDISFFFIREQIIKAIRDFFLRQNFHEVITPVLNAKVPLEPNIFPFETEWKTIKGKRKLFLSTSPEKNLKKMIALGIGDCFSIGHSFRNLESSSPLHTPEFLMLEWYRKNADYKIIMSDVQNLIISIYRYIETYINKSFAFSLPRNWKKISLADLFSSATQISFKDFIFDDSLITSYAAKKGYQIGRTTWRELYDQIFVNEIELHLPKEPLFLIDFPLRISPLCKPKKDKPYLAERFELYIKRVELANGNTENTDAESIKKSLRKPIDYNFLKSLKKMQNASYAGVGLGIDRLIMIFTNKTYIKFD